MSNFEGIAPGYIEANGCRMLQASLRFAALLIANIHCLLPSAASEPRAPSRGSCAPFLSKADGGQPPQQPDGAEVRADGPDDRQGGLRAGHAYQRGAVSE